MMESSDGELELLGQLHPFFSRDTLLWGYTMHLPEQSRPNRQLRSNEPEL